MEEALEKAEREWDVVNESHRNQLESRWNRLAEEWDEGLRFDQQRKLRCETRIAETINWLKTFGLFDGKCDVADIGCGPGRFVGEFAKQSEFVLGVDISSNMTQYGKKYTEELGLTNTKFYAGDFSILDIDSLGWSRQFDLVFSSITPAIRGKKGLNNLIQMSRGWCFNSCFVYYTDDLQNELIENLFQRPPRLEKTAHSYWFKQLFDLLWLRGYHPNVRYYKDHREDQREIDRRFVEKILDQILGEDVSEKDVEKTIDYLKSRTNRNGKIEYNSDCWFGWILWNVNDYMKR